MLDIFKKIFSIGKKIAIVSIVFFAVIYLFLHFINNDRQSIAISPNITLENNQQKINEILNNKKLDKTIQGRFSKSLFKIGSCFMIGEACQNNLSSEKNYQKSALGNITNLITLPLANPPASGILWAYDSLEKSGFIPKTYAAEGIGFAVIKPYIGIWKVFRNLSYMLLVIVLIAIGFMVMFRMKMNPQTVMSVENALPKIIVALILITFSFPIAGLIIDLMYLSLGLIVSLMISDPQKAILMKNQYMMATSADIYKHISIGMKPIELGFTLGAAFTQILPIEVNLLLRVIGGFAWVFISNWLLVAITDGVSGLLGLANVTIAAEGIGELLKGPVKIIIIIILTIMVFFIGFIMVIPGGIALAILFSILFLAIRILFSIVISYIKLIITIVISPLLLLFEAIPSGKSPFKFWVMSIIGNLIVFPIMIFCFILAYMIIFETSQAGELTARLPYLYGLDSASFRYMIGTGIIFLIPDFVKSAKDMLGIKELPFTIGVGTYFGGVSTVAGGGISLLSQFGSINLGLSALGLNKGGESLVGAIKNMGKNLAKKPPPSGQGKGNIPTTEA